jgi:hypothetical protein
MLVGAGRPARDGRIGASMLRGRRAGADRAIAGADPVPWAGFDPRRSTGPHEAPRAARPRRRRRGRAAQVARWDRPGPARYAVQSRTMARSSAAGSSPHRGASCTASIVRACHCRVRATRGLMEPASVAGCYATCSPLPRWCSLPLAPPPVSRSRAASGRAPPTVRRRRSAAPSTPRSARSSSRRRVRRRQTRAPRAGARLGRLVMRRALTARAHRDRGTSKRSRFMTLVQTFTKSRTNFSLASLLA